MLVPADVTARVMPFSAVSAGSAAESLPHILEQLRRALPPPFCPLHLKFLVHARTVELEQGFLGAAMPRLCKHRHGAGDRMHPNLPPRKE